jgi:tetratricopeptide (TPR) repeat protein
MVIHAWLARARRIVTEGESLRSRGDLWAAKARFATALGMLEVMAGQGQEQTSQVASVAHLELGRTYLGLRLPDRALEEFAQSRRLQPAWSEAFYWTGCAQGWLADYQGAERSLSAALRLEPGAGRIHLQRGYARFRLDDLDGALVDLLAAEARDGLNEQGRLTLAAVRLRRGEGAAAEQALAALEPPLADSTAAFLLAWAREHQGDPDGAVFHYRQALRGDDRVAAAARGRLGMLQLRRGDLDDACRWLEATMATGAADDHVLAHHVWTTFQLRRFDRCAESWATLRRRPARQGPTPVLDVASVASGDGRGLTRARAALQIRHGRWGAAATTLGSLPATDAWRASMLPQCLYRAELHEELLRLRSSDPELRFWQGLAHADAGSFDQAVRAIRYVLQRRPGDPAARRALHLIRLRVAVHQAREDDWGAAAGTVADTPATNDPAATELGLAQMLILLLGERRGEAVQVMRRAFQRHPTDPRTVHNLALLQFHGVAADADGAAASGWALAGIGVWAALLRNAALWDRWRARTRDRYGLEIAPSELAGLRSDVEARVRTRLEQVGGAGRSPTVGDLPTLFERELSAAMCLANVGGLRNATLAGQPLACGPMLVRDLGLEPALGSVAASRWLSDDLADQEPAASRPLRLFSQLGPAQVHLDAERPAAALAALEALECPSCAARQVRPAGVLWRPAVCLETCPEFDRRNPAFSAVEDKGARLLHEAMSLTVDVRLSLAQAQLTGPSMDVDAAIRQWRGAIYLAGELGRHQDTQRRIIAVALSRATALERQGDFDEAITLLERGKAVTGSSRRGTLDGRLGELLADRGIRAANEHPSRLEDAVADLRRSVAYNPHALRPLRNFVIAVRMLADELVGRGRLHEAMDLLGEAVQLRDQPAGARDDDPELRQDLEQAERELDRLLEAAHRPWAFPDDLDVPP